MASRLMRAWLTRTAVTAAAVTIPLLAAGSAQAAIAGATPGGTSDRADLLSATITSATTVNVCFDKPITGGAAPNAADFLLGGYVAGRSQATPAPAATSAVPSASSASCVTATYDTNTIGDIDQYTIQTVNAGGVTDNATGNTNRSDSTTLTGSDTKNGTAGLTSAPNLASVTKPPSGGGSNNSLIFVFDKAVVPPSPTGASGYAVTDSSGNYCTGAGGNASVVGGSNGRQVLVTFPATCSANNAIQGETVDDMVDAASNPNAFAALQTKQIAGSPNGGMPVNSPALVSAVFDTGDHDAIDYTFNKPLANTTFGNNDFCFTVSAGTGAPGAGTGAGGKASKTEPCAATGQVTLLSPTVVRATFNGQLRFQREYAVQAQAYAGAVTTTQNGGGTSASIDGSTSVGDNAQAFARGFTTGPDVTSVVYSSGSSQATVSVDQRLCEPSATPGGGTGANGGQCGDNGMGTGPGAGPVTLAGIMAFPSFGNAPGTPPTGFVVNNPDQNGGPQTVTLQFPGGTSIQSIQFATCDALQATLQNDGSANAKCSAFNVAQIDGVTTTAAIAKAYHVNRTRMARRAHRAHKSHRAHRHHHRSVRKHSKR